MLAVPLLYIGAVLLVNGVALLGKADLKGVGVLNLLTGIITFVCMVGLFGAWWAKLGLLPETVIGEGPLNTSLGYNVIASAMLFGFTYLYLGACLVWGLDMKGVGWYALWVSLTALPQIYFLGFGEWGGWGGDWRWGIMWITYAILWFMFFVVLALGRSSWMKITAWWTIIVGVVFVWWPAYLMLINHFHDWK